MAPEARTRARRRMKILLSFPVEHDKTEGRQYLGVLRRLGHEVVVVNTAPPMRHGGGELRGYAADADIEDVLEDAGGADLYLYLDPLGLIPRGLAMANIPTACVICDTHRQLNSRLALSNLFDHVFLYHRNYVPEFEKVRKVKTVHWMPYACDLAVFRDLGVKRDIDVAFVGQSFGAGSERWRVLRRLAEKWTVNEQRVYRQDEIPGVYSRARIVVNMPLADDLNFRVFEAMACGAMLLTRRVDNGQNELYRDGEHFVTYGDEEELFAAVERYLGDESGRAAIARAGFEETVRANGLEVRLREMLRVVASGERGEAPARRMTPAEVVVLEASIWERGLHLDAVLRALGRTSSLAAKLKIAALAARGFLRAFLRGVR